MDERTSTWATAGGAKEAGARAMTADIRTAAQREAAEKFHWLNRDAKITSITAFVSGAEWAHRVTPTREQIAEVLAARREPEYRHVEEEDLGDADAVLALMTELAKGES